MLRIKLKIYSLTLLMPLKENFRTPPPPPHFDRTKAAVKILNEAGMPLKMIYQGRYYVIDADDPDLSLTFFGSPLEEFLKRADVVGIAGKYMYYDGKSIEPKVALQEAEEAFNANLYKSPWIQDKARKSLANSTVVLDTSALDKEAKRIAENYETETEEYRTWIQGLKTWVNTVPILGPLYTIGEGIQAKDTTEIVCGVFFLGLDAFDVLFQGEADEELEIEGVSARENLSVRDRMAVDNVDFVFDDLDLSLEDLALEDNYLSHTDWFTLKKNNVPSEQHALAERVRNGEQGLEWNEYELVYLSAEDRVVPVKSQGGYFQEIDWVTGEKVRQKPFIFRDSESKKYYAMRLKGGNPDTLELEETALKQRETIKKTESILAKAKDHTIYDFATRYQECFSTLETPGVSAFNFFEFYKIIYKTSPTFRRIFNRYYEAYSLRPDKKNWEIAIYQNAVTRTDFTEYKIHIASDIEILQMHYVGNTIHEASRPEQIYLHEMLHALTGERDPIRAVSIRHRGPIVYLTDKILSEAGYVFPQRIMYRRLSDVLEISGGEIERKQLRQFMKIAKALVSQENSYLDRIVDKDISVFIERKVFGEEIAERYTVKESELIWSKIKNVWVERDSYIFGKQFEKLFSAVDEGTLQGLQAFYANFYEKSTLFAKLFDNWAFTVDRSVQRWRFEIDNPDIFSELPANKQVHCINDLTKKIYIFDDKTLYLSDKGLIPVERARQLLHEMVQILTEFKDIPAGIALRNRGAVVQLCDEIFAEMELNLPKRLVSALVRPDDIEKQTVLLSYQLEASRAVRLENKFIEQRRLLPASSHCPPICRSKRSSENSPRLNTRLFLKDKQENISLIKQTIKNNLKKHKLTQAVQHNAAEAFFLTKTSRLTFLENETFTLNENSTVKNDTFFIAKSLSLN